ncbi:30S ribosomal protein S6 [Wolbachia endosymbiont of Dirofilaria (Dirofilaria) immitis]|uniref:30S ribosomal protein S6 n=1 Tax=Wolbachia endosymbiont of Dirofilaria (Dirofilaria) immitis TaxID=1812115 RepID=UPI00397CAECD
MVKVFQETLKDCEITNLDKLGKTLEILLENIEAPGLIKYEYWGLLDFAYPINKMKSGHYCMMCIDSTSSVMSEFIRRIKLNENVIRYLSVQVDKFSEGKSYMMNKQVEEQSA